MNNKFSFNKYILYVIVMLVFCSFSIAPRIWYAITFKKTKGIVQYFRFTERYGGRSGRIIRTLKDVKQPMLFLSGTRDEFATPDLIENACSSLKNATLIKIEGANHGFKAGKQNTMEMLVNFTTAG